MLNKIQNKLRMRKLRSDLSYLQKENEKQKVIIVTIT